ncbi:MAG: hypothetical protein SGCHY_003744 [Lobulomycetales sp.]
MQEKLVVHSTSAPMFSAQGTALLSSQANTLPTTTPATNRGKGQPSTTAVAAGPFLHHPLFGKPEKADILSAPVKQLIIKGTKRNYIPEKVKTRNESSLVVLPYTESSDHSHSSINLMGGGSFPDRRKHVNHVGSGRRHTTQEMEERKKKVLLCGFCSDPREPYKTLGNLFLEPDALLFHTLQLPSRSEERKGWRRKEEQKFKGEQDVTSGNTRIGGSGRHVASGNGFPLIQERIKKGKVSLATVKSGASFLKVMNREKQSTRRVNTAPAKSSSGPLSESDIDWKNLKIDSERQIYYQGLVERRAKAAGTLFPGIEALPSRDDIKDTVTDGHTNEKSLTAGEFSLEGSGENTIPFDGKLPVDSFHGENAAMEAALRISRSDKGHNSTRSFLKSREKCYEQRLRLTNLLEEDLVRKQHDRKEAFARKFKSLTIDHSGRFVDDLKNMRVEARKEQRQTNALIISRHPWFNELINKVVMTGGVRRTPSYYENMLIERIRGVIVDGIPFDQSTFVRLLKVLPTTEFNIDEIQRIIRYVKHHISLSERDYVEAVELSGHVLLGAPGK